MSTYEPGTVAVATVRGVPNVRVFRFRKAWVYVDSSHTLNPSTYAALYDNGGEVTDVRPLVVLDLDALRGCWADTNSPAAIVERLRETNSVAAHAIADQIEAQTRPPKPPEPTGLGAVVEDVDGVEWILVDRRRGVAGWHHCDANRERPWRFYEGIDAVRVLSEGVRP